MLRRQQLCERFGKQKVAALLVTNLNNLFYLTGFRGSAGVALIGPAQSRLWVDPRYMLQAREQVRGVEVIEATKGLLQTAVRWVRKERLVPVGFEDSSVTYREFSQLQREGGKKIRWVPAGGIVEKLRMVKDAEEISLIRKAGQMTAEVFEEMRPEVRPGIAERDLAAEIEYRMKRKGADGPSFETIVASGARSAWPHARPSCKLLQKSELVIIDLGVILGGYAADMTRALFLGAPGRRIRQLYNAVRDAQQRAVEAAQKGRRAGDIDAASRTFLEQKGLESYFTHSTGHGVGLDIHERPRVGRADKTRLDPGCVITVEPGVYIEGLGGVRVEDTVLITADGPEILTPAAKDNWFTG